MDKLLGQPCPLPGSVVPDPSHLKSAQRPGGLDSQTALNLSARGQLGSVWGGQTYREPHRVPKTEFENLSSPGLEELPVSLAPVPSETPRERGAGGLGGVPHFSALLLS